MKTSSLGACALVLLAACGGGDAADQTTGGVALTGAGATFPYPLYSRWFSDYAERTGIRINYQSIGSGGGIRQISEGTVDFGASDSPMTDEELARAQGEILHIPTVIGAVAVTYNLPTVQQPLRFTGDLISDIFRGEVTRWNDPRIAALNPGVTLPDQEILVVHRSDGSGTTFIFTDYLAEVSQPWARGPGRGKEVQWPSGVGAKGNEGVAGQVKQTPGAIGYVELAYANQNQLPTALVRNQAGNFVAPTIENVTAAGAGVGDRLSDTTDYRISIVDAPGEQAYPISSFTWLLVYRSQPDSLEGQQIVDFIRWALTEGGETAVQLDYAPLPESMRQRLLQRLETIQLGAPRQQGT